MSDKDFKVKNGLTISGLTGGAGPLIADSNKSVDSTSSIPTQYGGTGTTTSPSAGQVLYSENGTTYAPATLSNLAVTASSSTGAAKIPSGTTAQRPESPIVGQIRLNTESGTLEFYTGTSWGSIATFPQPPTNLVATDVGTSRAYNNASASIAFNASTANGGSTITSYKITSSPGGFFATGSSSPIVITGLQSNTSYTFTGTSTNSIGEGGASVASSSVLATTIPQPAIIGVATVLSTSSVSVSFTPQGTGGKSVTYTVNSNVGSFSASDASSPITVNGAFVDGTSYTFTVTASNANGSAAASSASNSVVPVPIYELSATFNTTSNFTIPSGKNLMSAFIISAGGGGGGGGGGSAYMGGGGGGGAAAGGTIVTLKDYPVTPGENYAITVGTGGNGGNGGNTNITTTAGSGGSGTTGGTTNFGNIISVAGGNFGSGGGGGRRVSGSQGAGGGGGGTGNAGNYNVSSNLITPYIQATRYGGTGGGGGTGATYFGVDEPATASGAGNSGTSSSMNLSGLGSVSSVSTIGGGGGGGGGGHNYPNNGTRARTVGSVGGTGGGSGGNGGAPASSGAGGAQGNGAGGAGGGGGGGGAQGNDAPAVGGPGGDGRAGQVVIYTK